MRRPSPLQFTLGCWSLLHPLPSFHPPSLPSTLPCRYELGCWATWDCSPPGYCSDGYHGFALGGNRTAAALRAAGYAYQHVYGLNQWHCGNKEDSTHKPAEFDPSVWTETLAETLAWIWEGYASAGESVVEWADRSSRPVIR